MKKKKTKIFTMIACFAFLFSSGNVISLHSHLRKQNLTSRIEKPGDYLFDLPIPPHSHLIDHAYYFLRLQDRHARNYDSTSSIISLEILLGYYDTYYSDDFVDDKYDIISKEVLSSGNLSVGHFSRSPGVDDAKMLISNFHDDLLQMSQHEIHYNPDKVGVKTNGQVSLLKRYLKKREISFSLHTSMGLLGDIWTNWKTVQMIKNAIDHERPIIVNGYGHSSVAFAYNENYVWVHTGWGATAATPWSTFESGLFSNYSAGAIDLEYHGEHTHSNNYYAIDSHAYLCPCGYDSYVMER